VQPRLQAFIQAQKVPVKMALTVCAPMIALATYLGLSKLVLGPTAYVPVTEEQINSMPKQPMTAIVAGRGDFPFISNIDSPASCLALAKRSKQFATVTNCYAAEGTLSVKISTKDPRVEPSVWQP
jgi:hypothetical protein